MTTGYRPTNLYLGPRRTSVRLEPVFLDALRDVAARQHLTLHDLAARAQTAHPGPLSAALRAYVLTYYRGLAAARA